ncbi:GNAT family N-acetyltransferase [Sphingobium subterraneum]|uniref:Putative N-acetyltransferase YhbS n=1 Tax=Sphingobium subterraneum TaxID=627688 RepID=A0A841IXR5_9SPHN|nr:putative N-acetyltransferase YhbS [Sphingobium subterraneum]
MTTLKPLDTQKADAIEALLDAAFGTDRHGRTAYAIRRGTHWLPELSLAALDDAGILIGLLQSWPVQIVADDGATAPLIMVGPVAVLPELQRAGAGRAMMDHLIEQVDASPTPPLVMIGDPEYYGRFWGFAADGTSGWRVPGPVEQRRLLVRNKANLPLPQAGMLAPRLALASNP